jgi:hypothetical protein
MAPSRFTPTIGMTSVGATLKRIGRALIASTTLGYQSGRSSTGLFLRCREIGPYSA